MNTIKIYLAESGRVADLKKDFPLYQYQFQNKLLNIYVPTSIMAPEFISQNAEGTTLSEYVASTSVKIGMSYTARDGSIKKSKNYYVRFLKTLTYQNVEYALYERKLPKEFTLYAGQGANAPILTANVVNIQQETESGIPTVLSVITTQTCSLDVMASTDLDIDEAVEPTELENINAQINEINEILPAKQDKVDDALGTTNKSVVGAINENKAKIDINTTDIEENTENIAKNRNDIDYLKENMAFVEEYIGQMTGTTLPTSIQLTHFVQTQAGREPKNADVIIFVLQIAGGTDKNYKYIYSSTGWNGYEIPPLESASNGTLGLVEGTYATGLTMDTLVDISGGRILNIYVKDNTNTYRNIREYLNTTTTNIDNIINGTTSVGNALRAIADGLGNNIVNTYLTQTLGASKQYVRDYAMPREFNDVYFISSNGYEKTVPTTPESGVQFTAETNAVGSFPIFQIERENNADFELSSKNGYSNNIYISSNVDSNITLRLTTQYKKTGSDWEDLNIELTSPITLVAGDIQKVMFGSPFAYLEERVVSLAEGDLIRQTLEVVTQSSTATTFNIYSNEVYPSTFNLTSQSYVLGDIERVTSKIILLGLDGVIEANRVVFEVQDAESFIDYRTNQREFLVSGILPIVGELDRSLPVAITFGDTTYQVYTFMKGSANPITIGDLMSVSAYNTATGFAFFSKLIFLETSDIVGFAISPATLTASQLAQIIDDTDGVVVGLDPTGTMLQLQLNATITSQLARALKTPMSAPSATELVAIDDGNSQIMLQIGEGLVIRDGVLIATAGGGTGGGVSYEDFDKLVNNEVQIVNSNSKYKLLLAGAKDTSRGITIGNSANTNAWNGIAIGHDVVVNTQGIAIGQYSSVHGTSGIAIGISASAQNTNSYQLGSGANNIANSLQIGSDNIYKTDTHTLTVQNAQVNGSNVYGVLFGTEAPTTTTVGSAGQIYIDTVAQKVYQCISVTEETVEDVTSTVYTWVGMVNQSEFDKLVNNETQIVPINRANIAIGGANTASTTESILIGKDASGGSGNRYCIAIGLNSYARGGVSIGASSQSYDSGSIALGYLARSTNSNTIQLGAGTNNTPNSLQIRSDNIYKTDTHTLTVQNIELNGVDLQGTLSSFEGQNEYIGRYEGATYTASTIQTELSNFVTTTESRNARSGDLVNIVNAGSGVDYSGQQWRYNGDTSTWIYYIDFENHSVINNLTSTSTTDGLSAMQGKVLNDMLNSLTQELVNTQNDVADNMTDISTLQGKVSTLESDNTTNKSNISSLQTTKANQSALDTTNQNVANLDTNKANKNGNNLTSSNIKSWQNTLEVGKKKLLFEGTLTGGSSTTLPSGTSTNYDLLLVCVTAWNNSNNVMFIPTQNIIDTIDNKTFGFVRASQGGTVGGTTYYFSATFNNQTQEFTLNSTGYDITASYNTDYAIKRIYGIKLRTV